MAHKTREAFTETVARWRRLDRGEVRESIVAGGRYSSESFASATLERVADPAAIGVLGSVMAREAESAGGHLTASIYDGKMYFVVGITRPLDDADAVPVAVEVRA